MKVKFDSRLDKGKIALKVVMILPLLLVIAYMFWEGFTMTTILLGSGLLVLGLSMSVWQLSNTFYTTDERYLHFRSGSRRGKIEINNIECIQKCQQWWPLGDASRSLDGFLIHFRHGQLFVGPRQAEQFIGELRKINPGIRIKG